MRSVINASGIMACTCKQEEILGVMARLVSATHCAESGNHFEYCSSCIDELEEDSVVCRLDDLAINATFVPASTLSG
jgi:hypothetical protein